MSHQRIKYTERKNKACHFLLLSDTSFGFGAITAEIRKFLNLSLWEAVSLNYASICMQQALSAVNRTKPAYSQIIFIIHVPVSGLELYRKAES